ncbi:MFS transporter [uncultured Jatrophihabitans sp.]|uniref:MFS transporter n=1 Tax=uncultured Jatrophihabitans sp. TaxID=1610747 RepID=UPI0035CB6938
MITDAAARPRPAASLQVVTITLAVACGLTVANLYYSQPLLELIARDFHVSQGTATLVVTLTQVGYALGLLFVLPLGDLVENRTLVTRVLLGTAVALVIAAVSPDFGVFVAASVLVGLTSVVAQILVPVAAHLAPPEQSGRLVGRVMSGLLLGILLARTVSSLLAGWLGWRAIYVVSAVLMVVLVVLLHRVLPARRPDHTTGYRSLLASVGELVRHEPILRARALCQGTMFGAFTAFWTAIAYELIDEHGLSQTQIALFALIGAGGATAAPIGGWLADRGHGRSGSGVMLVLAAGAVALAGAGHSSVILLALGGVLLDLAVQCHQVMGQQEIYALRPTARARINTVYMTTVFVSGAISSAVAGLLHDAYGWTGVCWFAAALPLVGLVIWAFTLRPSMAPQRAGTQLDPRPAAG